MKHSAQDIQHVTNGIIQVINSVGDLVYPSQAWKYSLWAIHTLYIQAMEYLAGTQPTNVLGWAANM